MPGTGFFFIRLPHDGSVRLLQTANLVYGQFAGSLIINKNCGLFLGGSN